MKNADCRAAYIVHGEPNVWAKGHRQLSVSNDNCLGGHGGKKTDPLCL